MTDITTAQVTPPRPSMWRSIGPALIVAAVVLGPGSILTSSKVGAQYGYNMLWVTVMAGLLMIGSTALSAYLGCTLDGSLCDELAKRLGRPFAAFVGIILFLVVAGFQSSNNLAVLAGLEPLLGEMKVTSSDEAQQLADESAKQPLPGDTKATNSKVFVPALLIGVNVAIIAMLLISRDLYRHIEVMMKVLVAVMVLAFAANLIAARPSISGILGGLVPQLPAEAAGWLLPKQVDGKTFDPLWAVQGLIATTFSIAGAFYQSYLVREKGWRVGELRQGMFDTFFGITALTVGTAMIMITSASVLHGKVDPESLKSAGDVAVQLEPMFGQAAVILFSIGIFAGAFSSFLVNAMIGGALLSDGFAWGASINSRPVKLCTIAALGIGMVFALLMNMGSLSRVDVIVLAQALTVLGGPVLAGSLIYLAIKSDHRIPGWMLTFAILGGVVTTLLALRTAVKLLLPWM